jgi:hypothetical protein
VEGRSRRTSTGFAGTDRLGYSCRKTDRRLPNRSLGMNRGAPAEPMALAGAQQQPSAEPQVQDRRHHQCPGNTSHSILGCVSIPGCLSADLTELLDHPPSVSSRPHRCSPTDPASALFVPLRSIPAPRAPTPIVMCLSLSVLAASRRPWGLGGSSLLHQYPWAMFRAALEISRAWSYKRETPHSRTHRP